MKKVLRYLDISRYPLLTVLLFLVFYSSTWQASAQQEQISLSERLKKHVQYLASDELEGRYPGKPGNKLAADYIAAQFKTYGLRPLGNEYFQFFNFTTGLNVDKECDLAFSVLIEKPGVPREMLKPIEKKWAVGVDWQPLGLTTNNTLSGVEVVFAGYGISSAEQKYDDYEGIDVTGKAVVVLTETPWVDKKMSESAIYEELKNKTINARNHGAVAVIFVKKQGDSCDVFFPLKEERMFNNSGILVLQATRTSISKMFHRDAQLFPAEKEITKSKKPKSFLIKNIKLALTIKLSNQEVAVPNVVGMVKGAQIPDEYIVVGAHFDHLGWGGSNSMHQGKPAIHNGADDNASGVATIIELASEIAKKPLKRSVIFIAFNGEEEGLLGSAYYTKEPLVPLEKTVFMMNFDMVGRLAKDKKLNIFGIGSSTGFGAIVDSISALDSSNVVKAQSAYGPSDQSSFYYKGIPVMFLFTGVHGDYHKPSDDWDKLNYDGMAKISNFALKILETVGNAKNKPDYIEEITDPDEKPKMNAPGNGAWFGIVPNFEENPKGFLISGTSDGSPAQKAGLKANDIITTFDGAAIKNLYDLNFAIKSHKPGDEVEVIILRGDKEMKIKVTLSSRK